MSKTPELEKLDKRKDDAFAVSQFLEWLYLRGLVICRPAEVPWEAPFIPIPLTTAQIVHKYLNIDEVALEEERRKLLRALSDLESRDDVL